MYCKKCGQQIPDASVFCDLCGADQRPAAPSQSASVSAGAEKPVGQRKKLSKKAKAIISLSIVLAIIIGIAAAGLSIYSQSPAREVMDQLAKGKYEEALGTYQSDVSGSSIHNALFKFLIKDKLSDKLSAYSGGTLKYDEALPYLSAIVNMEVIDSAKTQLAEAVANRCAAIISAYTDGTLTFEAAEDELCFTEDYESLLGITSVTEKHDELIVLNNSKENFESGESYFMSGDYEDAIEYYGKVSEDSAYYEQAQSMIASAISQYRTEMLDNARTRVSDGDYVGAIALLEAALEIITDDAEITTLINTYSSEYFSIVKNDALTSSTNLSADGDFLQAMEILRNALDIVGDDAEIQRAYDSCVSSYVEKVTNEVNAMLDEDWNAAHELMAEALNNLPSNEQLIELNQEVMRVQPIELNTLTVVDSVDLAFADGIDGISDSYGNVYYQVPYLWTDYHHHDLYVMYNLSKSYTSLSCTIAPHNDFDSEEKARVVILLDDEKVFEKAMTKTTAPFRVELDVSDSTLLKIYLVHEEGGWYPNAGIIIADGIVKK